MVQNEKQQMETLLREIWVGAGRPGAAKLYTAVRRKGLQVKLADVEAFVKGQETRQVFAPAPRSQGKVTATGVDDRWQVDLINWLQMDASKNNGFRNVLVVVDVFSRFAWVALMKGKTQEETVAALRAVFDTSGRKPAEVDSDGGQEFGAAFTAFLEQQGVAHRVKRPEHTNALAVVDAVIRRLKETLRQDMVEEGTQNWVKFMPRAVRAHNSNSHEHLMDSAPDDVKGNEVLQYALKKQAGQDALANSKQHADRVAALRKAGAFRVLLPAKNFSRTTTARWSNEVHRVAGFVGTEVLDKQGARFPVRETLPVDSTSKDARAPADLGGEAKQAAARERLTDFARVLNGFLGSEGLTLQGAGKRMRNVPGFSAAMEEAKLTGIGALERFIRLFPQMFAVDNEGQRKRVRRAG